MEIREFRRHPLFLLDETSRLVRSCWNFCLRPGENTRHRMQAQGEEIYLILAGRGRMTVGGKTGPVRQGEVIFVPPRVAHHVENTSSPELQGVSIETAEGVLGRRGGGREGSRRRESPRRLDEILAGLPEALGEGEAIRAIVELFEIASTLSEQVEEALGLDNELGDRALRGLEKKLMEAVGALVDRYRLGGGPGLPRRWRQ